MDYILSPVIERESLPYLASLIESYIISFKETVGDKYLIPKHHYMLHILSLTDKFGPLKNLWCMNFEAKHQYFKMLIVSTQNFINVTHTLTERHQMKLAHTLASAKFLDIGIEPHAATKTITFGCLPQTLKMVVQEKVGKSIISSTIISTVTSLKVDGIVFNKHPNTCFVLDFILEWPCFAQVKHMVLINDKWYLCLKIYFPSQYIKSVHAYEVECQPSWIVVSPNELVDTHRHRLYRANSKTYAYMVFHVTKFHKDH